MKIKPVFGLITGIKPQSMRVDTPAASVLSFKESKDDEVKLSVSTSSTSIPFGELTLSERNG